MASRKGAAREPDEAIKVLEAKFDEQFKGFQKRLEAAPPSTELQQLAADFDAFKNIMQTALDALKIQVSSLTQLTDELDNRSRRKFLLFRGITEAKGEDLSSVIRGVVSTKLKIKIEESELKSCFRLGTPVPDKPRPILVKFVNHDTRSDIWRVKKELKGSAISIAEFLTTRRREIFKEARQVFGKTNSWTQDGNIFIKLSNGKKIRLSSLEQLRAQSADTLPTASRRDRSRVRQVRGDKK